MASIRVDSESTPVLGHKVGNLDDLDSRFKCTHCHLLLRDPVQGDCGHRFCRNCVLIVHSEALKLGRESACPACLPGDDGEEVGVISPDRTYPDQAVRREITKTLKVRCPNAPCDFLDILSKLIGEHAPDCSFKPLRCDLCNNLVPADRLTSREHQSADCPKRRTPCDLCQELVPFDGHAEHKATECVGSTVQCQYCLARIREDDQDRHCREVCPVGWHQTRPCPYGCEQAAAGDILEHRTDCVAIHVDRTLARIVGAEQPVAAKPVATSPDRGASATAEGGGVAAATNFDFDKVHSFKEKAARVEARLLDHPVAMETGSGDSQQTRLAAQMLESLQVAVSQGDKVQDVLKTIREQLEAQYDKLCQLEKSMLKAPDRLTDFDRRRHELEKLLVHKEIRITDLQRRIELLEMGSHDGILVWRISHVRRWMDEAREGKVKFINSPQFFTSKAGYRMSGRLYLNGDGVGRNTHVSLHFFVMRGEYDALLPWPFAQTVAIRLIDPSFVQDAAATFKPDPKSASFKKPVSEFNPPYGYPRFVPLGGFDRFIKDDTIFIKFVVDKNDLPT